MYKLIISRNCSYHIMLKYWDTEKHVHEVLVNRLGGLILPSKSEVRLTDHPDMTLDVYRGRKTTIQQHRKAINFLSVPNVKLVIFRCPKIWAHHSLIIMCSNIGIPNNH